MAIHSGLVHRPGVIIQPPGDGEVHGEVFLRDAEGREVFHHSSQLVQPGVKGLVLAAIGSQLGQDRSVVSLNGHEVQNGLGLLPGEGQVLGQNPPDLVGADLFQLVGGAHDVPGLVRQALHGIEAIEDLAVIDPDGEIPQTQSGEGAVDDRGDLGLVGDVQLTVADDVDVRLVKLPEAAPLGSLPAIDLPDLEAAEGEGQLVVMQRHIFRQGDRQIKAQGQVAVPLFKAVDLLFGLAAALGQQNLRRFDHRRVQRGKAIETVIFPQDLQKALHLHLPLGQKLHKARQGAGLDLLHKIDSFLYSQ